MGWAMLRRQSVRGGVKIRSHLPLEEQSLLQETFLKKS